MELTIYLYMTIASIFFAINENLKAYALKYIPKSLYNSRYFGIGAILLTLLWIIQDKKT